MVESILKPRVLPRAQWPILRSLILTEGSNYVFRKTIKYPANVNHSMLHEPAFDQLRTKEQLGYIVFSGPRAFSTTYGFRFLIQSEMTPEFLDSRIESFLMRYADTMEKMSETENLGQESTRHWSQITNEFYDFELAQRDAAQIKLLTKPEVEGFFNQRLNPASSQRARLSIHLQAQGKAEGVAKRQKRLRRRPTRSPPQERT
ncbi:insulysin [Fusarium oxysporum f. sp. radicis-lycopersici 26381]|nr:insulysin [Fusarium oxysporum f. sp. radicis-lycopersici 26381]